MEKTSTCHRPGRRITMRVPARRETTWKHRMRKGWTMKIH
jgi:hypothetical protein